MIKRDRICVLRETLPLLHVSTDITKKCICAVHTCTAHTVHVLHTLEISCIHIECPYSIREFLCMQAHQKWGMSPLAELGFKAMRFGKISHGAQSNCKIMSYTLTMS